jgi:hypothetical protein
MPLTLQPPPAFGAGSLSGSFQLPDVRSKIPPQYLRVFDRFVLACKRVMYDPRTHALMQRELAKNVPMAQKLAEGVVGLVLILYQQQKGKVPAAILIPAAVELLGDATAFLTQAGQPIDKATYAQAVTLAMAMLSKKLGITQQLASAQPAAPGGFAVQTAAGA